MITCRKKGLTQETRRDLPAEDPLLYLYVAIRNPSPDACRLERIEVLEPKETKVAFDVHDVRGFPAERWPKIVLYAWRRCRRAGGLAEVVEPRCSLSGGESIERLVFLERPPPGPVAVQFGFEGRGEKVILRERFEG